MTPETKNGMKLFFISLLILAGIAIAGYAGHLFETNNVSGRGKAAINVLLDQPQTSNKEPINTGSFVSIPKDKQEKKSTATPTDKNRVASSDSQKSQKVEKKGYPKDFSADLGWTRKLDQQNVFKMPKIFYMERIFSIENDGVARRTLTELFKGPTAAERAKGCCTKIPSEIEVVDMQMKGTTLHLKLSIRPDEMGWKQIEGTMKRLKGINDVKIKIS